MFDIDTINEIGREEQIYNAWVREEKNRILKISNSQRKQTEWSKLFAQPTYSEEINNMIF